MVRGAEKFDTEPKRGNDTGDVHQVAARQHQGFARNTALQLGERNNRAGKRNRADKHAEENLYLVNGLLDPDVIRRRVYIGRKTDQHGGEADEAVQNGHELRHLRHLDF